MVVDTGPDVGLQRLLTVQVDGQIKYYSKNCTVDEDGVIKTAGIGKKSYIVYDIEE